MYEFSKLGIKRPKGSASAEIDQINAHAPTGFGESFAAALAESSGGFSDQRSNRDPLSAALAESTGGFSDRSPRKDPLSEALAESGGLFSEK